MRCAEVMELMQRNLDGNLSSEEFHRLESHLLTCNDCRELNDRFKQLSFDLESLPEIEPPFSLVDAILPSMNSKLVPTDVPLIEERKKSKRMYWAMGSGAVAVLVVAVLWPWANPKVFNQSAMNLESAGAAHKSDELNLNKDLSPANDTTAMTRKNSIPGSPIPMEMEGKKSDPPSAKTKNTTSTPIPKSTAKSKKEKLGGNLPSEIALDPPLDVQNNENLARKSTEIVTPSTASNEMKQALSEPAKSPDIPSKDIGPAALAPSTKKYAMLPKPSTQDMQQPNTLLAGNGGGGGVMANQQLGHGIKYPSPDGKQTAAVLDQSIVVQNSDGVIVYQGHHFDQVSQVNIHWLDYQQLAYELYQSSGVERWRINLIKGQEQKE